MGCGIPFLACWLNWNLDFRGFEEQDFFCDQPLGRWREKIDWQEPCKFYCRLVGEWPENQILIPDWTYFYRPGSTSIKYLKTFTHYLKNQENWASLFLSKNLYGLILISWFI